MISLFIFVLIVFLLCAIPTKKCCKEQGICTCYDKQCEVWQTPKYPDCDKPIENCWCENCLKDVKRN